MSHLTKHKYTNGATVEHNRKQHHKRLTQALILDALGAAVAIALIVWVVV